MTEQGAVDLYDNAKTPDGIRHAADQMRGALVTLSAEKAALEKERAEAQTAFRDMYELYGVTARQLAEARGALERAKAVIEGGYERVAVAGAGARTVCEHGQFLFQDCIGCYDESLLAALALPAEQGEE